MAGNSYQILSVNYDGKRVLKMSGFKYAAINEMPLPSCDQITGKFEPKQCKDRMYSNSIFPKDFNKLIIVTVTDASVLIQILDTEYSVNSNEAKQRIRHAVVLLN